MINLKFNNKVSNSIFSFIPALLIIFSLILMWEFCVYIFDIEKWLLPSPSAIFLDFIKNTIVFLNHTYVTLIKRLIGFILAYYCSIIISFM
jgi:ABC-type nitrate/sulfonate/bicarbonate transport system, permease component